MRPRVFQMDGFAGLNDTAGSNDGLLYWMENFRFEQPGNPRSALVARGPWNRRSTTALGTPAYGTPTHTGGVYEFIKNDGTALLMLISGGKVYTWNGSLVSESLSASDLSGASVTLSSSAVVYMTTFNNTLVVSDGVNTPWTWNGTVGSGITKLTNAPVAYGPPTVYYDKLFFIKNTDRATVVWSEEAAANTGYEASGYNNAWTLLQSGSEPLVGLMGTNEALLYWRLTGHGSVRGAVTPTFSTDGTHDEGSEEVGLMYGSALGRAGNATWFADQFARPWVRRDGGAAQPLWRGVLERTFGLGQAGTAPYGLSEFAVNPVAGAPIVEVAYCPAYDAMTFAYTASTSAKTTALFFAVSTGQLIGVATWGSGSSAGTARIGSFQALRTVAYYTGLACITRGARLSVMFENNVLSGADQTDMLGTGNTDTFVPLVIGPQHGNAAFTAYHFEDAQIISESGAVGGGSFAGSVTCTFDYLTSIAYTSALMATAQTSTVSSGESGQVTDRTHLFGLAGYGRWMAVRVQLAFTETSGPIARLALKGWNLTAFPDYEMAVR